jgi:hypothetical protein
MAFSNTSFLARMECTASVQSRRDDDEDCERTRAKSQPTAKRKAEIWNHSLMTEDYTNREEWQEGGKCCVMPQDLVGPQYVEGYVEGTSLQ